MIMLVLELWSHTVIKTIQGRASVDDSLIAIVVVVMVAWKFIQFAISEKPAERVIRRDANDKEGSSITVFSGYEKSRFSFTEMTNEGR
jgi:hypothetical protein